MSTLKVNKIEGLSDVEIVEIPLGIAGQYLTDLVDGDYNVTLKSGNIITRGPWVDARAYGTLGAQAAIAAAIVAISTDVRTLYLTPGTWTLTGNLSIPSNIDLRCEPGAVIAIPNGITLTIAGTLSAGPYQIFSCTGTGKAAYDGFKYVQWWGAVADGTTDSHLAIQSAVDSGVGPVFLPNISPNTTNPGTVNSSNYYLGTTAVTIIKPDHFKMDVGTSLVYDGTDSALIVDCHAQAIEGLVLELYDVYTTGNYCLKTVGDGIADGNTAYIAHGKISAHRFCNFEAAGFFSKWCRFVENNIDIQNMYAAAATPNAAGYYFDDTDQVANSYEQESNKINTITVNSRVALYGPGTLFDINEINIGTDYGSLTFDVTQVNMTLGGSDNIVTVPFVVVPDAQGIRTTKVKFLSTSYGNTYITPPTYLTGIVDEAPVGSNIYSTTYGKTNYLKNPSFESWFDANTPVDWTEVGLASQTTTYVKHGKKGCTITSTGGFGYIQQTLNTALVGVALTFSGWFKSPATNTGAAQFGFSHSDVGGITGGGCSIPNDGLWHFLAFPYTPPVGATGLIAVIYADTGVVDQSIYADGLFICTGSTPVMLQTDEKYLYSSKTWTGPIGIATGAISSTTVGCLGAAVGDPVSVGFSGTGVIGGVMFNGSVTSADTVTVTAVNHSATNPVTLASGTLTVVVNKQSS